MPNRFLLARSRVSRQLRCGSLVFTPSDDTATLTAPDTPGLSAQIEVTVSDADGNSSLGAIVISTLTNRPPQIASFTAYPLRIEPNGTSDLTVEAIDPELEAAMALVRQVVNLGRGCARATTSESGSPCPSSPSSPAMRSRSTPSRRIGI